ncbi:hypothetical protein D6745_04810 [Candidatus Woesearchaeota archaeon]|nr:MAG: hypothetical protein D6745_04810 [Candidatus Woesearchaeota archaeon]
MIRTKTNGVVFIQKTFERSLKRWGNSLAITIDSNTAKSMCLQEGEILRITIEKLVYDMKQKLIDDLRFLKAQPPYKDMKDEEILKELLKETKISG